MNGIINVYSDNPFYRDPVTVACTWFDEWAIHETPVHYDGSVYAGEYSVTHRCGLSVMTRLTREMAEAMARRLASLPPCPVSDAEARQYVRSRETPQEFQNWMDLAATARAAR